MFDTKHYEEKMTHALEHFENELKKIRTGRAHPDMLDSITVEVYGSRMPLKAVGNVTAPEAQQLLITPFDPSNVKAISEAIRNESSLGFNPSDDGRLIRVPIPALTEERRRTIVKQLGEKVEECRIAMRSNRQDALKDAKRRKEAKELSENDIALVEKDIDKMMSEFQTKIDEIAKAKEKEIMTI
jgi:ribosome recycling factor